MKREIDLSWDDYFMGIAKLVSLRSKDPETQVGACIVSKNNRILSLGYNGTPNDYNDDKFPWDRNFNDIPCEYKDSFYSTKYPYVCHAELNAFVNFVGEKKDLKDARLYVTLFPCNECAKLLIQSGIKEIIYLSDKYYDRDLFKSSRYLLEKCNIKLRQYDKEKDILINLKPE